MPTLFQDACQGGTSLLGTHVHVLLHCGDLLFKSGVLPPDVSLAHGVEKVRSGVLRGRSLYSGNLDKGSRESFEDVLPSFINVKTLWDEKQELTCPFSFPLCGPHVFHSLEDRGERFCERIVLGISLGNTQPFDIIDLTSWQSLSFGHHRGTGHWEPGDSGTYLPVND